MLTYPSAGVRAESPTPPKGRDRRQKVTPAADARPAYRPFRVFVRAKVRLSPTFLRLTLEGADLGVFGTAGLDQRIKVLVPSLGVVSAGGRGVGDIGPIDDADGGGAASADWYARWRSLDESQRNPIRTYTIRAVRQQLGEIDIDFALHGDVGPASAWALAASIGDELVVVGPDARSADAAVGIEWHPGAATTLLLAGDETAVPAISAILEALPADAVGAAILEVPDDADFLPLAGPKGVEVHWHARRERSCGELLEVAVRAWTCAHLDRSSRPSDELAEIDVDSELLWEAPAEAAGRGLYAWFAGEAGVIKALRRFLVTERGVDRRQVAFMGYWRHGKAETN